MATAASLWYDIILYFVVFSIAVRQLVLGLEVISKEFTEGFHYDIWM